jgi:hypothetical protein
VIHGRVGASDAVCVHARDLTALGAVGDAYHIAVLTGENVEGVVPSLDVTNQDDAVGMGLFEHGSIGDGCLRLIVDVTEEEAILGPTGSLVDPAQDLDVERVGDVTGDDTEK